MSVRFASTLTFATSSVHQTIMLMQLIALRHADAEEPLSAYMKSLVIWNPEHDPDNAEVDNAEVGPMFLPLISAAFSEMKGAAFLWLAQTLDRFFRHAHSNNPACRGSTYPDANGAWPRLKWVEEGGKKKKTSGKKTPAGAEVRTGSGADDINEVLKYAKLFLQHRLSRASEKQALTEDQVVLVRHLLSEIGVAPSYEGATETAISMALSDQSLFFDDSAEQSKALPYTADFIASLQANTLLLHGAALGEDSRTKHIFARDDDVADKVWWHSVRRRLQAWLHGRAWGLKLTKRFPEGDEEARAKFTKYVLSASGLKAALGPE